MTPTIVFEDPNLIVLDKPAGMLSQGEKTGDPNIVDWLRKYLGRRYVGLVHRLDRNTSGLLLVAKRTKSAQRLTKALQSGKICRLYRGWVSGRLLAPQEWQHWLKKEPKTNLVSVVAEGQGSKARLKATPVRSAQYQGSDIMLLEFDLQTGRSHQIRVQAAAQGYPLLGDNKYGGKLSNYLPFSRPALHAYKLKFPHPISGEVLTYQIDMPEDLFGLGAS